MRYITVSKIVDLRLSRLRLALLLVVVMVAPSVTQNRQQRGRSAMGQAASLSKSDSYGPTTTRRLALSFLPYLFDNTTCQATADTSPKTQGRLKLVLMTITIFSTAAAACSEEAARFPSVQNADSSVARKHS